jgi:RsiW-degrading membrane proteinase PrsW (M82 family)
MIHKHFSDEQIQEYILTGKRDESLRLQISGCETCVQKMKAYQVLIGEINTIEPVAFSYNISEIVMQKIESRSRKEKTALYILYGFLLSGISGLAYFALPIIATAFRKSQPLHSIAIALLITGAIGVIIFSLADMFRIQKEKELQISL